jgi:hypothetical protein
MKKVFTIAMTAALAMPLLAQEVAPAEAESTQPREERRRDSSVWPAIIAICEYPESADVVGLRLTIPFSTRQENVTGFDVGLWGRALTFEGLMANVLRNDVKDDLAGVQVGLYNSAGGCDMLGVQVGLWNEAGSIRGVQAGLINVAHQAQGVQFGIINRAEEMYGFQVGLVNVIRDAELQFCPVLNVGF